MTKEKYLLKNSEDANVIGIINQVKTVIFGDNMIDQDPEMEIVLRKRRTGFLDRVKQDLDQTANMEYFKLQPISLFEQIRRIIQMFCATFEIDYTVAGDIKDFAKAAAMSIQPSIYSNYFGECPICIEDMIDENQPVITQCNHVYHQVCLEKWIHENNDKNCPICRTKFDKSGTTFYTLLTADV